MGLRMIPKNKFMKNLLVDHFEVMVWSFVLLLAILKLSGL